MHFTLTYITYFSSFSSNSYSCSSSLFSSHLLTPPLFFCHCLPFSLYYVAFPSALYPRTPLLPYAISLHLTCLFPYLVTLHLYPAVNKQLPVSPPPAPYRLCSSPHSSLSLLTTSIPFSRSSPLRRLPYPYCFWYFLLCVFLFIIFLLSPCLF